MASNFSSELSIFTAPSSPIKRSTSVIFFFLTPPGPLATGVCERLLGGVVLVDDVVAVAGDAVASVSKLVDVSASLVSSVLLFDLLVVSLSVGVFVVALFSVFVVVVLVVFKSTVDNFLAFGVIGLGVFFVAVVVVGVDVVAVSFLMGVIVVDPFVIDVVVDLLPLGLTSLA